MSDESIKFSTENFPEDCFLKKLVKFTDGVTDAPDEFIVTSGLAGMATVVGQNVWQTFGSQRLYPNIYVIKIGQSSKIRKTTTDNIVVDMLLELCPGRVFPNEITPEMFLMRLAHNPACLLRFNEMGSALKKMETSHYMQGMKSLILELYDVPRVYDREIKGKKKGGEKVQVQRPTMSVLGSSTLEWFNAGIKIDDIASGFLPRFLFTVVKTRTKEKLYFPSPANEEARSELVEMLRLMMTEWKGEKTFSEEAKNHYVTWMKSNESILDAQSDTDQLAPFIDRLEKSVIKMAMLMEGMIQASKGKGFKNVSEISKLAIIMAIELGNYFQACVKQLVLHEFKLTQFDQEQKRVISVLKKYGGECTRRTAQQYTKFYPSKLMDILEVMEDLGLVEQETLDTESGPSYIVRLIREETESKTSDDNGDISCQPDDNQLSTK